MRFTLVAMLMLGASLVILALSASATPSSSYIGQIAHGSDDLIAYYPLNDRITFSARLRSQASSARPAFALPSASDSFGFVSGYGSGFVSFGHSDSDAVVGESILATGSGSLAFPLNITGAASFTAHFWVKAVNRAALQASDASDELPFFSIPGTTLELTTRQLRGGIALTVRGSSFADGWNFVAVSVDKSVPSSAVVSVSVNGGSSVSVDLGVPFSGQWFRLNGQFASGLFFDEVAVARSLLSGGRLSTIYAQGLLGPCSVSPCFSGVQCTPLSSSRHSCGSCPAEYTGDGTDCHPRPVQFVSEYRPCTPSSTDLLNPEFCSLTCNFRWTCMQCATLYSSEDALQETARGFCDTVFSSQRSATRTPSQTVAPSVSSSSSVSSTGTVTATVTAAISVTPTASPINRISCATLKAAGSTSSGFYSVKPNPSGSTFTTYCEQSTLGGGWSLVGHEDSGVSQTLAYLGVETNGAAVSSGGNGLIGTRFSGFYDEVLITYGSNYVMFRPTANIFANSASKFIGVSYMVTNDAKINSVWGGAGNLNNTVFCRASVSGSSVVGEQPGDTSWALTRSSDTNRGCGCNSGGWSGNGAYYGGRVACNQCSCWGGGFAGGRANGEQKGGVVTSYAVNIYVRELI